MATDVFLCCGQVDALSFAMVDADVYWQSILLYQMIDSNFDEIRRSRCRVVVASCPPCSLLWQRRPDSASHCSTVQCGLSVSLTVNSVNKLAIAGASFVDLRVDDKLYSSLLLSNCVLPVPSAYAYHLAGV